MADGDTVVVGLRALQRDFRNMCEPTGALAAAMRNAGREAVAPIAEQARTTVPVVSGALERSIVVSSTRLGAMVREGGGGVVYAGPVEFGGYPPGRDYLPQGRYLWPAAQVLGPQAADFYAAAVKRTLDNYHWTNTSTDPEAVHD
jgi:hypothetical protein